MNDLDRFIQDMRPKTSEYVCHDCKTRKVTQQSIKREQNIIERIGKNGKWYKVSRKNTHGKKYRDVGLVFTEDSIMHFFHFGIYQHHNFERYE